MAPVSFGVSNRTDSAKIAGNSYGMRVQHREYIADVNGAANFTGVSRSINPGIVTTFPWLSILATNFEKYHFRKLHFIYESSVATTSAGVAMSAIDMDAADAPPTSKQQMMSYLGAQRSNVWMEHKCILPQMPAPLYVRTQGVPAGTDVKTYDVGNYIFASQGAAATPVGELYVEYDVDLLVPQLVNPSTVQGVSFTGPLSGSSGINFATANFTGSMQYTTVSTSNSQVAVPALVGGKFIITWSVVGSGAIVINVPSVFGSTGTVASSGPGFAVVTVTTTSQVAGYVNQFIIGNSHTGTPTAGAIMITRMDPTATFL